MACIKGKVGLISSVMASLLAAGLLFSGASSTSAQVPDADATIAALQTQVAELQGPSATPTPTAPDGSGDASDVQTLGPVNLQLILDVSGSMAQVLPTGE